MNFVGVVDDSADSGDVKVMGSSLGSAQAHRKKLRNHYSKMLARIRSVNRQAALGMSNNKMSSQQIWDGLTAISTLSLYTYSRYTVHIILSELV